MTTDFVHPYIEDHGNGAHMEEYDENSSARLFERSRIKALAGQSDLPPPDSLLAFTPPGQP